eukprot:CAMPEP_0119047990 /NCGR_PEP_ID=MMETSP1177-20130426/56300_1 /TAXON_ID=2985 /ORGANISM="Ochromonas sp, Strain CCMP1899" /LENGTH=400 /DNA_ID=CAMNT_0007023293 /DNA_START=62 /DNA_END=1264 /DNA_ORIENTATION=+
MSNHFLAVETDLAIDGGLSAEGLNHLSGHYKSVLYICCDDICNKETPDFGVVGGYSVVAEHFPPPQSIHIPLNPADAAYQSNCETVIAVRQYSQFESALDRLQRPTAIVCKSARRAGAIYAAYKGVKEDKASAEVLAEAENKGLSFVGAPGLVAWLTTVVDNLKKKVEPIIFKQMIESESSTYTYLLADPTSKEAVLIDPVLETVERDLAVIKEMGLTLKYAINTHVHADHITGSGLLKQAIPACKSIIGATNLNMGALADIFVNENDKICFGDRYLHCFPTPGHTEGCFSFVLDDFSRVFTGDALLINGCGRTDFQGGSSEDLYQSVRNKIFSLPNNCTVLPAHDYKGLFSSTVSQEKTQNPRLTLKLEDFVVLMAGLQLPYPKKIDASMPANLKCGII